MIGNIPNELNGAAQFARCYGTQLLVQFGTKIFGDWTTQYKGAPNHGASSVRKMEATDWLKHGKMRMQGDVYASLEWRISLLRIAGWEEGPISREQLYNDTSLYG